MKMTIASHKKKLKKHSRHVNLNFMFDELNYTAARNVPKKLRPESYIIEWAIEVDMLDEKLEQDVYSKIRSSRAQILV